MVCTRTSLLLTFFLRVYDHTARREYELSCSNKTAIKLNSLFLLFICIYKSRSSTPRQQLSLVALCTCYEGNFLCAMNHIWAALFTNQSAVLEKSFVPRKATAVIIEGHQTCTEHKTLHDDSKTFDSPINNVVNFLCCCT